MDIQDILQAIDELDTSQLYRISQHIEQRQKATMPPTTHRILNLHKGAMTYSHDFDAPLPDDFWLGDA